MTESNYYPVLAARGQSEPELVWNNPREGIKVFNTLEKELAKARAFAFSVAFIAESGLQLLKPILKELEERNIPGYILTTDYLLFSEPKALNFLESFSNIELRLYCVEPGQPDGLHTKGYILFQDDRCCILTGSSNLTQSALTINKEWNTRVYGQKQEEYTQQVLGQLKQLWTDVQSAPWSAVKERYTEQYELARTQKLQALAMEKPDPAAVVLQPNTMQGEFSRRLQELLKEGASKALLVSATGTGKTYAAAFAVRKILQPGTKPVKRMLFVVHRQRIAEQALQSFYRVFGGKGTYGLLGGGKDERNADYLFSTIQTMNNRLEQFAPDDFDVIIIDEVHHAGARSYQKLMNYFKPRLFLGMSATPYRKDSFDIYSLFDHNVPYELSLKEALEENLLTPFHYYGIHDLEVDGSLQENEAFRHLVSDERVRHIMEQADYYGFSGKRRKGLIFVSRIDEAKELSHKLNERGLRTIALSGEDSDLDREMAIERLTQDENNDEALDYIISVDIFNEGVDIPEVNQVLLLRPTQSANVFVQQLGRGLRKDPDKEYTVVLDFIGAYEGNYLIPYALGDVRSGNKDIMRRYTAGGSQLIPGASTVHFDKIAQARIFSSIDKAQLNSMKNLREAYNQLKNRLGRIPGLLDYEKGGALDPQLIFSKQETRSYPAFLKKVEKDYAEKFSDEELKLLGAISYFYSSGKRLHEVLLLEALAENAENWEEQYHHKLDKYELTLSEAEKTNVYAQMLGTYWSKNSREIASGSVFLQEEEGSLKISDMYRKALENETFRARLTEVLDFAKGRWQKSYNQTEAGTSLVRGKSYTYQESFRMMNFEADQNAQNVGGYLHYKPGNTFPVYINYDKAEDIAASIQYEDHFDSPNQLTALSKNKRTLHSPEIEALKNAKATGMTIRLFMRKNTEEKQKEFYYLGEMEVDENRPMEETLSKDGVSKQVKIHYQLKNPVPAELYDYFTNV